MEGRLGKQEAILTNVIAKLDANKENLESIAKKSEKRAGKMEQEKKALESCVKKSRGFCQELSHLTINICFSCWVSV